MSTIECTENRQYRNILSEKKMPKPTVTLAALLGCLLGTGSANALTLSSPDINPTGRIAQEQVFNGLGCSGGNISPTLNWLGAPKGTKSFALSVYDPDAPTRAGFWRWVIFNIPPNVLSLPRGAGDPRRDIAPKDAVQIRTDFGAPGYIGPCQPKGGKPHRYLFTIFAVDVDKLDVDAKASAAFVAFILHFHTLAEAQLTSVWGR
jgi:Raf kinase inhibitor-like YbhB/YbcL family protein